MQLLWTMQVCYAMQLCNNIIEEKAGAITVLFFFTRDRFFELNLLCGTALIAS